MGRIQLEVLFGEKGNSRREPIWFEVVDISSPYHVLLGSPGQVHGRASLHVPQDEAPGPSRRDHNLGM
jgi:hypothetical protein